MLEMLFKSDNFINMEANLESLTLDCKEIDKFKGC